MGELRKIGGRNDAVRDEGKKSERVPLLFDSFETVERMAKDLISNYHPHLTEARIKYICRNRAARRGGNLVPGNVYKMSGKFEYLVGHDFVVEVALEVWNDLSPNQRTALIDHLLSRCVGEEDEEDGSTKWRLIPPEVQEFPEVAERHGRWNDGLVSLGNSLRNK